MSYDAQIIADSIYPDGVRLTTFYTVWPHAVHKDFMTHRVLGRNFESFRAQPTEKVIAAIREHPFMPDVFAKRIAGMGQGVDMDQDMQATIRRMWTEQIERACALGDLLVENKLAKQQANFLLQDFAWITGVVTATEWDNFFALRTELKDDGTPVARPEVYKTAKMMRELYESSEPRMLASGEWHLPFVTDEDMERHHIGNWALVSAGRCARISYGFFLDPEKTQTLWDEELTKGIERARKLQSSGHMSPFEHPCRPVTADDLDPTSGGLLQNKIHIPLAAAMRATQGGLRPSEVWCGNVRGWVEFRKTIVNEENYGAMKEELAGV